MKTALPLTALLLALSPLGARADADAAALDSRITAVTVYADRARVTRVASVSLREGEGEYVFARLPGWLDEDSVRVGIAPPEAARIADVRIEREYLARPDDAELQKAQAAVQELADRRRALEDERKALEAEAKQVGELRVFAADQLPREANLGRLDMAAYAQVVDFVGKTVRRVAEARRAVDVQLRDLQPEAAAREKRLAELRQRCQLEQRTVRVTLAAPAARPAEISLTYFLPGATWQPVHELRADALAPTAVQLASYALVSQTTGEDWTDAALSFSTQSPGETIRIPEVESLRLGLHGAAVERAARATSFSKAQQIYAGQNDFWYRINNPEADLASFEFNSGNRVSIEQRTVAVFEQLQERGTTAHFAGEGRPAVRSDGQLVRVPIGAVELAAAPLIVAAPERSLNAVRTVELTNSGGQPLLPGQVALYQGGAFLGFTDLDFVAEGEHFSVLLGVADQLKLSRVLDSKLSSLVRGNRSRMYAVFNVGVENLSDAPVALRLLDRVPVSEDREVRVYGVDIDPEGRPDAQGLLTWDIELKPKETRTYRIAYGIEYPRAVLASRRDSRQQGDAAAAPAELYKQIEQLESKF